MRMSDVPKSHVLVHKIIYIHFVGDESECIISRPKNDSTHVINVTVFYDGSSLYWH